MEVEIGAYSAQRGSEAANDVAGMQGILSIRLSIICNFVFSWKERRGCR
jgi:hypothetical protein